MKNTPPGYFLNFFRWYCHPKMRHYIEGDLMEVYQRRVKKLGKRKADMLFIVDVLLLFRPGIWAPVKKYKTLNTYDMLKNYYKSAIRNMLRYKVYSSINIVGLSLGLACTMLIILYVKDELGYDNFHINGNNIYRVVRARTDPATGITNTGGNSGALQGPVFTASIPEIRSFVRFVGAQKELKRDDEIINKKVCHVDSGFFSVFTFPLLSGNPATALTEPHAVVITESMAIEHFGTVDVLGKIMLFKEGEEFVPYNVTAVARNTPQNSSIQFDILLPLKLTADHEDWGSYFLCTFVVLDPRANPEIVESKMKKVYETEAAEDIKTWAERFGEKGIMTHLLQPFTDIHLSKKFRASNGLSNPSDPMYSYILAVIAVFILIIACINFVNLTVGRSVKRAKEIGIRKVVGGLRNQLIFQFLSESFVICFGAFLLAFVIVQALLPTFNHLVDKTLSQSLLMDSNLIAGYVALLFITGLLAGFYPAFVLSNYNPVRTLYNRFVLSGKNLLQKGLVVFQFALACLLVVATIVVYSQFDYLVRKDLGYNDEHVVILEKRKMNVRETKLLKQELLKSPDIIDVAFKNDGRSGTVAKVNGETQIGFDYETIDETYLALYKIPVVEGRNFSPEMPADSAVAIMVNEAFVRAAGWKDPVGQVVDFWHKNEKYTVIGVVKDHHFSSLSETISPQLFTMRTKGNEYGIALVRIKPGTETASLGHIQRAFSNVFPMSSYIYRFKDLENLKHYESEARWKQVIVFGTSITIFISCMGLFGLSVLSTEKRAKEIGIRKVLGATAGRITATLTADFLKLVVTALLIAMPLAWFLGERWLQKYPYRISLNGWIFVAAGLIVMIVAAMTVSFQSVKVANANPVKSLRSE